MGVVIDFVAFVLGRPRRPAAGHREAPPVAAFDEGALRTALAQLDAAQAGSVLELGGQFLSGLGYGQGRRRAAARTMRAYPEAAWILCFDSDGHIREAAVRRLDSAAATTGRFVALALRLNDWVPQVRREAVEAFRRVRPLTPPAVIAGAAPYLLRQRFAWRRWTDEGGCIDDVLGDPAVAAEVIALLLHGRSGALGRTLTQALRFSAYDGALAELALQAALPDVRAVAVKTILNGAAVWPVGYGWAWVNKPMGERRRVTLTESRPISILEPPTLLCAAIADRSALVRKVAAAAVIERMNDLPDVAEIVARLAGDSSAAVRDRADYIARHLEPRTDAAGIVGPA